ncbi:sensor domain-containing protein [Streptomyces sp. NPDC091217]|uniref:sensor domain-containing protein n=1 Tax=Streptomyces sp. NPDC091217 TaxID=3365975 RepID=UPI00382B628D
MVLGTPSASGDTARRSGLPAPCNAAQLLFTPVLTRLQCSRLSALLGIDIVAPLTASGSWRSRHRIAETLRSEALWRQLAYHVLAGPFVALGALTVLGSWALGALFTSLPLYAWALPAGPGAKGERVCDWAATRLPAVWEFDGDRHTHQRCSQSWQPRSEKKGGKHPGHVRPRGSHPGRESPSAGNSTPPPSCVPRPHPDLVHPAPPPPGTRPSLPLHAARPLVRATSPRTLLRPRRSPATLPTIRPLTRENEELSLEYQV